MTISCFAKRLSKNAINSLRSRLYEVALGQKVNAEKSSVFFSHNTPQERRCEVLDILSPMQDTRHGKYLGLPSIIGRSKTEVFQK